MRRDQNPLTAATGASSSFPGGEVVLVDEVARISQQSGRLTGDLGKVSTQFEIVIDGESSNEQIDVWWSVRGTLSRQHRFTIRVILQTIC